MSTHRCPWAETHDLLRAYHDEEWGVPVRNDDRLFEMLTLEGAQAGLSWLTVLKRRESYRRAFANFQIDKVARFTAARRAKLLADPGLIRHAGKIDSVVTNARAIRLIQGERGSFAEYVWSFTEADPLSRDLRRRGFKFVGPTISLAFMQAAGLVNDHVRACFRRKILLG